MSLRPPSLLKRVCRPTWWSVARGVRCVLRGRRFGLHPAHEGGQAPPPCATESLRTLNLSRIVVGPRPAVALVAATLLAEV